MIFILYLISAYMLTRAESINEYNEDGFNREQASWSNKCREAVDRFNSNEQHLKIKQPADYFRARSDPAPYYEPQPPVPDELPTFSSNPPKPMRSFCPSCGYSRDSMGYTRDDGRMITRHSDSDDQNFGDLSFSRGCGCKMSKELPDYQENDMTPWARMNNPQLMNALKVSYGADKDFVPPPILPEQENFLNYASPKKSDMTLNMDQASLVRQDQFGDQLRDSVLQRQKIYHQKFLDNRVDDPTLEEIGSVWRKSCSEKKKEMSAPRFTGLASQYPQAGCNDRGGQPSRQAGYDDRGALPYPQTGDDSEIFVTYAPPITCNQGNGYQSNTWNWEPIDGTALENELRNLKK